MGHHFYFVIDRYTLSIAYFLERKKIEGDFLMNIVMELALIFGVVSLNSKQ